eukprot:symbB.v1.2.036014.t1/scaffold4986.1/size32096/1
MAMCCGLIACFCTIFWPAVVAFWAFNMAGAALMPGAFGLMLCAVQTRRRPLASALAQLPINLLGMAGGAFIPGWIAGCDPQSEASDAGCDYAVGLKTLLCGPAVGMVLLVASFLTVQNPSDSSGQSESTELSNNIRSMRASRDLATNQLVAMQGPLLCAGVAGALLTIRTRRLPRPRPVSVCACQESWKRNLLFVPPSGFWADDDWYDLQMERRLPLTRDVLRELIYALPPLKDLRVADLGAGTGRSGAALATAYPSIRLTLIDPDEGRLRMAVQKLPQAMEHECKCIAAAVAADGTPLPGQDGGSYDCIVALQAVRHIVAPPVHYAAKLKLPVVTGEQEIAAGYAKMFAGIYASLKPGGHFFLGDHVVHHHPGVFAHCQLLEEAGFTEIDVAWRQNDWFVIGARRPV